MDDLARIKPRDFRIACREGRYAGTTRGVALGYLQCNLVILRERYAYEFLLYCQRNQKACPVLEVCEQVIPSRVVLPPERTSVRIFRATRCIAAVYARRTKPMLAISGQRIMSPF